MRILLAPARRARALASRPRALRIGAALAIALCLCACSSLSIERKTQTSGTFRSTGIAVTILSWDIPKSALDIARENASDARLTNTQVEHATVTPYLGGLDWLLDIIGVRFARISGTWGFPGAQ
jgi:hypothetical protein